MFLLNLAATAYAHLPSIHHAHCAALLAGPIRTPNTEIRLLNTSDLPTLRQVLQDPSVAPKMMLDVSDAGLSKMLSQPEGELHFGIYSTKDGTFLGMVSLWNPAEEVLSFGTFATPLDYPGVELGYALAPAAWGKGLGTEVAAQMANFALDSGWATKIYALTTKENLASKKVLLKAGFKEIASGANDHIDWFEFNR